MTLSITYQELQQIILDKLNQNIGLQSNGDMVLKILKQSSIGKLATIDSSVEAKFSVYGDDLYMDYSIEPVENIKKGGLLSAIVDAVAKPNAINVALSFFRNKYPQYSNVIEKVPNADRLRIHLAAIPQLKSVLQYIEIESVIPQDDGLLIIVHMKK